MIQDRGRFDVNNRTSLFAVSNADGETPVSLWADPTSHRLLFSATVSLIAGGTTSVTTQVGDSTSVQTLKASNTSRVKLVVVNTSTAILYVKEGPIATTSDYSYRLEQYDGAIIDDYSGLVTGIWSADSGGFANCTETT